MRFVGFVHCISLIVCKPQILVLTSGSAEVRFLKTRLIKDDLKFTAASASYLLLEGSFGRRHMPSVELSTHSGIFLPVARFVDDGFVVGKAEFVARVADCVAGRFVGGYYSHDGKTWRCLQSVCGYILMKSARIESALRALYSRSAPYALVA